MNIEKILIWEKIRFTGESMGEPTSDLTSDSMTEPGRAQPLQNPPIALLIELTKSIHDTAIDIPVQTPLVTFDSDLTILNSSLTSFN